VPTSINRSDVQRLVADKAQLVEVLPEDEYLEEHLPGAIHLPLKSLTAKTAAKLDKSNAVIVYCWDALCDMSPRAARHLERFGFDRVYDYTTGKADWIAAGLPTEGRGPDSPRVSSAMSRQVPTCQTHELIGDVVKRVQAAGWTLAVVVNPERVILGQIRLSKIDPGQPNLSLDEVMDPGPATVRADADLNQTLNRLANRHVESTIVSTPDGELLGVLLAGAPPPDR
jgi:rhodanese-related sulfurtransferase